VVVTGGAFGICSLADTTVAPMVIVLGAVPAGMFPENVTGMVTEDCAGAIATVAGALTTVTDGLLEEIVTLSVLLTTAA
jgi:hypothetical protein